MSAHRSLVPLLLALLAGLALPVGIAACGGQRVSADEVSAPPPDLAIPGNADTLAGAPDTGTSSNGDTNTTSTNTTDTTDTTAQSGSTPAAGDTSTQSGGDTSSTQAQPQATQTPSPASGGAQAPTTTQKSSPAPAASGTQKYEEFCRQNAGAC